MMNETVLGAIRVSRPNMMSGERISSDINEIVYFKKDRTVVARTYGVFRLVAHYKTREKHRFFLGIGPTNWYVDGYEGAWKDVGEKFGNMLRPIFKERLIVKK